MPIRRRHFAFALVGLFGLMGAAQAQPPWQQDRREEMREHEERREDRIRHEEREAEFDRERAEARRRHDEEIRAEERARMHREYERREYNR